jgi:hypothetical protein
VAARVHRKAKLGATCAALWATTSGYSAATRKLPGSSEVITRYPSRLHQSRPPNNSLVRNPSRASLNIFGQIRILMADNTAEASKTY